jgi:uncharacterized protein
VTDAVGKLVEFVAALRHAGLAAGTGELIDFCDAAAQLPPANLYWAGRITLASSPAELDVYDRTFAEFFGGWEVPRGVLANPLIRQRAIASEEGSSSDSGEALDEFTVGLASTMEMLRTKRFEECTDAELASVAKLIQSMRFSAPLRQSRRWRAAERGAPDIRRMARRAFRSGGEPVKRAWRKRQRRPRRLVLILDVSGSMAAYSRALLALAHAAIRADGHWEAFCFGTRLTRITRALATNDHEVALAQAAAEVVDWEGGTRIGESLKRFLRDYGHGGMARGAIVVICSDGLEVGDPELLAEQMAQLSRLAHRVLWLNPLKADPAYEPLARGMKAALPFVDIFLSGHDLSSLDHLGQALSRT